MFVLLHEIWTQVISSIFLITMNQRMKSVKKNMQKLRSVTSLEIIKHFFKPVTRFFFPPVNTVKNRHANNK